jgi:hypothetical protein
MNEIFKNLIQKYEGYLLSGERNLRELEHSGKVFSQEYQAQRSFVSVWRMVLNDFHTLADNRIDETAKKRD